MKQRSEYSSSKNHETSILLRRRKKEIKVDFSNRRNCVDCKRTFITSTKKKERKLVKSIRICLKFKSI